MSLRLEVVPGLDDVPAPAWDACASSGTGAHNPFVEHAFLKGLEDSGSVGQDAGWVPTHLVITDETEGVVGCAPMYLKNNSYGSYLASVLDEDPA